MDVDTQLALARQQVLLNTLNEAVLKLADAQQLAIGVIRDINIEIESIKGQLQTLEVFAGVPQ